MFGGGENKQIGNTSSTRVLAPEQQQVISAAMPTFMKALQPGGSQAYSGPLVAPTNPTQSLGQQMTLQAAGGNTQNVANSAAGGSQFLTSGAALDPKTNPGLQGAIDQAIRPLTTAYQGNLSGIRDNAVMTGGYGGSRQGVAEALANKDYLKQVGDTTSGIINTNYQAGLDAMTKGVASAPAASLSTLLPSTAVGSVGTQQQQQTQAQYDAAKSQYYTQQFLPLMIAQDLVGTIYGEPSGSQSGYSTGQAVQQNSSGQDIMGTLMSLVGMAGMFMGT